MAPEAFMPILLQQLAYQAPILLVCLIGLVFAVVLRPPGTARLLVAIGTGLLILVSVAVASAQAYLLARARDGSGLIESSIHLLSVVGVAGSISSAIGLALVIAAAFVGRNRALSANAEPSAAADRGLPRAS